MLKIGQIESLILPTVRESEAYSLEIQNTTVIKKSHYGHPNFTNIGLNKKVIKVVYTNVEVPEYETHKQYCSPFVTQDFFANLTNEFGITLLNARAFLDMQDIVYSYNMTKISYSITLYEL